MRLILPTLFIILLLIETGFPEPLRPVQNPDSNHGQGKVSSSDIQDIMQQLWDADTNRLQVNVDYHLSYQGAASENSVHDNAPDP